MTRTPLKSTQSRCPACGGLCPAEVWKDVDANTVHLSRVCNEHGETTNRISSDARFYWLSKGPSSLGIEAEVGAGDNARESCGSACACRGSDGAAAGLLGRNARAGDIGVVEKLSTCVALIEIVDSCNLQCPTCYAASPEGKGQAVIETPLHEVKDRIEAVIKRKGEIEILQLSGGEPTLHSHFLDLLGWAQEHQKIGYVLINTNGLRFASDEAFTREFAERFQYGKVQLYLQYDGPGKAGQQKLRGADLREMRQRVLEKMRKMNVPVTLAMTVIPENIGDLWNACQLGIGYPNVRGITFQPAFNVGRAPGASPTAKRNYAPLNTADIVLGLIEQSKGKVREADFTPLPCGDPNCATIGYLLKTPDGIRSISDFVDFKTLQGFLHDRLRYSLEDLAKCGCENQALGDLLKKFEMNERHTFRLLIKPFMDAWTWDEDRIDRCCTHVIRPDGKLDSFCRYYFNGGPSAYQSSAL